MVEIQPINEDIKRLNTYRKEMENKLKNKIEQEPKPYPKDGFYSSYVLLMGGDLIDGDKFERRTNKENK